MCKTLYSEVNRYQTTTYSYPCDLINPLIDRAWCRTHRKRKQGLLRHMYATLHFLNSVRLGLMSLSHYLSCSSCHPPSFPLISFLQLLSFLFPIFPLGPAMKDTVDSSSINQTLTALDNYVLLGKSGLRVSPLSLGTMVRIEGTSSTPKEWMNRQRWIGV